VALIAIIGSVPYIALQLKARMGVRPLETILSEDKAILLDTDHRRHRARRHAGDGGFSPWLFGNPSDRRHRAPATALMLAVATEVHRQAGGLPSPAGAFVTFWMFTPVELIETRDEDPRRRCVSSTTCRE